MQHLLWAVEQVAMKGAGCDNERAGCDNKRTVCGKANGISRRVQIEGITTGVVVDYGIRMP